MSEDDTGIFFCPLCDYITEIKSRYDKHTKLATCFKYQCNVCDFKTSLKCAYCTFMENVFQRWFNMIWICHTLTSEDCAP